MSDSDKPDTQALILKQLKFIKIALCLVVVMMLLLSGVIVVGGVRNLFIPPAPYGLDFWICDIK